MKYIILHPMNCMFNHELSPDITMFEPVAVVEADDMEQAFRLAQNDFNPVYASRGNRPTSVGDIIQSEEDCAEGKCHMISGLGFVSLPAGPWLNYKDKDFLAELAKPLPEEEEEEDLPEYEDAYSEQSF
jgi:hypothetical protein